MYYLLEILLDILIAGSTLFIGFITFMLVQLISYRVFHFNIWKQMNKIFR